MNWGLLGLLVGLGLLMGVLASAFAMLPLVVMCNNLLSIRCIRGLGRVFRNTGIGRLVRMVNMSGTDRIRKVVVTCRLVLMLIPVKMKCLVHLVVRVLRTGESRP